MNEKNLGMQGGRGLSLGEASGEEAKTGSAPGMAHAMHATFGLDHFPQYLHRWNDREIDSFEGLLLEQLSQVRQQRESNRRLRTLVHMYVCIQIGIGREP